MSRRWFLDVADHHLSELQRAARDLIVRGLITPHSPDEATFRRVRRWAPLLGPAFAELTGWVLHDSRVALRLERRPDLLTAAPWWPEAGVVPDARQLALLALTLAALERADDQLLLSELAEAVGRSAARAEVSFDPDVYADRRAFVHAVSAASAAGVLRVRDGQIEGWQGEGGEALLDVDRDVLRLLFLPARPLHAVRDAAELLWPVDDSATRDVSHQRRRQRLARRLISRPVTYLQDLDEPDRVWLRAELRVLAEDVELLTGGVVERRAEGFALVFGEGLSGVPTLPAQDGESVAALALASDLCAAIPDAPRVSLPPPGHAPPTRDGAGLPAPQGLTAPFVPDAALREAAAAHLLRLGDGARRDLREPEAFAEAAVTRLAAFDLVRRVPGGVCVLPAIARLRDVSWRAARPVVPPVAAPEPASPEPAWLFPPPGRGA